MASCNIAFTSVACYIHTHSLDRKMRFSVFQIHFASLLRKLTFLALLYLHMPFLYLSRVFLTQLSAASLSDKDGKSWKDKG